MLKSLLLSWEETCHQTDQSSFVNKPVMKHIQSPCFSFSYPFFIVEDFFERNIIFPEESREVVLKLSNGPVEKCRYAHLYDKWSVIPITIGTVVSVNPKDGWTYEDDDQGLYSHELCCYINDKTEGIVIFPHYFVKISSFGIYRSCPRAIFFRETHMYNDPTLFSLFGRFATTALQRQIQNECNGNHISAADIVDQLKKDYLLQLHHLSINQIDEGLRAIKSVEDFYSVADSLAEKIDEQHAVLMTIPPNKSLVTVSKAFPGYGARSSIEDETIWSFTQGFVGRPNTVVEIVDKNNAENENSNNQNDIEDVKTKYVPIEVIGTIGNNEVVTLKNGHIFNLTAQIRLLSEKYNVGGNNKTSHGFIWYAGSNQKFWVRPGEKEFTALRQNRNIIANCVATDGIPPKQVSDDCDNCLSRSTCALFERMKDRREYVDEIDSVLPQTMCDFSTNMARIFFNHYHRQIFKSALSLMWCCTRLSTSTLKERENIGCALGRMTISAIESTTNISPSSVISSLIVVPEIPGEHYKIRISRLDDVLITRDGSMPVLGFGEVSKLKPDHIIINTYEKKFRVGEKIAIDLYKSNQWCMTDNAILSNLLTHPKYSRIKSLIVDGNKPLFKADRKNSEFNTVGLNFRQCEAVSRALSANDYFLINAPHGTGRLAVGFRIISTLCSQNKHVKILVAPFYYSTINKVCKGLESLRIPYVVCGKEERIKEPYRYRHENSIFNNCKTVNETVQLIDQLNVFIIQSTAKLFDILCRREFDYIIVYEASVPPLIRVIDVLSSHCPIVLFGDTVLDHQNDSIFKHFQRINARQVLHLWDMYDCEPSIVAASRIVWGSELRCLSNEHAIVDTKPLKVISRTIRPLLKDIVSMDKPIVFVNISDSNFAPIVMVAIAAGLIYKKVNVIASHTILPKICSSLFQCQTQSDTVFTKYVNFMQSATERVRYYQSNASMARRKDMIIAVTDSPDTQMLTTCLGMARRKLIFVGDARNVGSSPLWATMLNQLPKDWIIDFPAGVTDAEIAPFKKLSDIFNLQ